MDLFIAFNNIPIAVELVLTVRAEFIFITSNDVSPLRSLVLNVLESSKIYYSYEAFSPSFFYIR